MGQLAETSPLLLPSLPVLSKKIDGGKCHYSLRFVPSVYHPSLRSASVASFVSDPRKPFSAIEFPTFRKNTPRIPSLFPLAHLSALASAFFWHHLQSVRFNHIFTTAELAFKRFAILRILYIPASIVLLQCWLLLCDGISNDPIDEDETRRSTDFSSSDCPAT
jgi:hypothetical protein